MRKYLSSALILNVTGKVYANGDVIKATWYVNYLGLILTLAGILSISAVYWIYKRAKREHQIQYDINQKKLAELKVHEEFKAQFKNIHQVRAKFKAIKR